MYNVLVTVFKYSMVEGNHNFMHIPNISEVRSLDNHALEALHI